MARMTAQPGDAGLRAADRHAAGAFRSRRGCSSCRRGAFRPAPKVESAVARLVPLGDARPAIADERAVRAPRRGGVRAAAQDVAQCARRRSRTRRRCATRTSIRRRAARRSRSPISCGLPTLSDRTDARRPRRVRACGAVRRSRSHVRLARRSLGEKRRARRWRGRRRRCGEADLHASPCGRRTSVRTRLAARAA